MCTESTSYKYSGAFAVTSLEIENADVDAAVREMARANVEWRCSGDQLSIHRLSPYGRAAVDVPAAFAAFAAIAAAHGATLNGVIYECEEANGAASYGDVVVYVARNNVLQPAQTIGAMLEGSVTPTNDSCGKMSSPETVRAIDAKIVECLPRLTELTAAGPGPLQPYGYRSPSSTQLEWIKSVFYKLFRARARLATVAAADVALVPALDATIVSVIDRNGDCCNHNGAWPAETGLMSNLFDARCALQSSVALDQALGAQFEARTLARVQSLDAGANEAKCQRQFEPIATLMSMREKLHHANKSAAPNHVKKAIGK